MVKVIQRPGPVHFPAIYDFYVWQTNRVYAVASATDFGCAVSPCATGPIIPAREMGEFLSERIEMKFLIWYNEIMKGQIRNSHIIYIALWVLISAIIFIPVCILLTGCSDEDEEDHGKVVKVEAHWWGDHYAGQVIKSGNVYVECNVTYEDGNTESVDDWTMKKPVTVPTEKSVSFYVYYGGMKDKVTVPKDKFYTSGKPPITDRKLTKEEENAMMADTLKEEYPGHGHQYYLDLLMNEGLTLEEAEEALSGSS